MLVVLARSYLTPAWPPLGTTFHNPGQRGSSPSGVSADGGRTSWEGAKGCHVTLNAHDAPQSHCAGPRLHTFATSPTDLHGDLAHAMRVFRAAKLVDHRGYWSGGDTTLVQTGDIVDRGKDTIALYRQMDSLRDQATRAGGRVISLLGNHEVGGIALRYP